jgi:transposase
MAKPLDRDLRIRLVGAVEGGMSCRAAARQFRVGDATVIRLMERYRKTGSVAPAKMGGHRPRVLENERDWILARIAAEPDITTRALADELTKRGIKVSHVSVWNLLKRAAQSHKKSP